MFISPSGVRSVWIRHELGNFKSRLKALEAKVSAEGLVLTEAQVLALEKKKLDDEACGEIETEHPGYLGSQDTFYLGTIKGVGRIYQHATGSTITLTKPNLLLTEREIGLSRDEVIKCSDTPGQRFSMIRLGLPAILQKRYGDFKNQAATTKHEDQAVVPHSVPPLRRATPRRVCEWLR